MKNIRDSFPEKFLKNLLSMYMCACIGMICIKLSLEKSGKVYFQPDISHLGNGSEWACREGVLKNQLPGILNKFSK